MNYTELGKLIKEARLAKKMTQSEVVGDFITRNMLSQIENGIASPSIRTLEYLARVLDLHINLEELSDSSQSESDSDLYIINSNASALSDNALKRLAMYKKLLAEGRYDIVADEVEAAHSNEKSLLYDEHCALLARSFYELAVIHAGNGDSAEAVACADKAISYAGTGIYANADLQSKALLLMHNQQSHS